MNNFSVALNTYNRCDLIGITIEAILDQSCRPAELVVVDDGSTDDTEKVLQKFQPHITYLKTTNQGGGLARGHAVSQCSHDWVACCDDDDLWHPNHLEVLSETIALQPDSALVFCNNTHFGPGADEQYNHFNTLPASWWNEATESISDEVSSFSVDAFLSLLDYNPVFPSCAAINASAYRRMGGAIGEFSRLTSEDSDITRRLSLQGRLLCNHQVTVRMRKHGENMSTSMARNMFGKHTILGYYLEQETIPEHYRDATRAECDRVGLSAFRHAYWEKDRKTATDCINSMGKQRLELRDRIRYAMLSLPFMASRS